ncbi:hypothetical protein [Gloeobacter kilaueensis]|uniref:Uncharacterized protein n=1 Tax=Gloeobacter kilaueensis (strain ATCC BAA-2537 / CCAP 1431/1 / ULC 316 / JS1) TaxID=1183438 RepID=U5QQS9_GLOK1|nr:hypothetical protein [Gloeobacter kilaueensis]AGY60055.1 hypothetical protein GKIL_3809 [Gloeobacter kilaueensis JS1]
MISQLQILDELRHSGDPDAGQRLELGRALLAIKQQRLYLQMGFARFESFLDSERCPFGHTVSRHAMRLAERTELHGALGLGVGRLTELMRLEPEEATRILKEGIAAGSVDKVSVRTLRRHVVRLQGRTGAQRAGIDIFESDVSAVQLIERWSGPAREQVLNLLLEKQFGQNLSRLQGLLQKSDTGQTNSPTTLPAFWPDSRRGVPQRWVALTTHIEALEQLLGADPSKVTAMLQRLRQPLEAWERAVFYLDLCRRDSTRRERFAQVGSACTALEKMLTGRDWHYNSDQSYLSAQLARGRQGKAATLRPFWRRLFSEVNPPQPYRDFLGQLASTVQQGEWHLHCSDAYQADFALGCLRHRSTRLFWQIAADYLGVRHIRLCWQEGGREHEQVVPLQLNVA